MYIDVDILHASLHASEVSEGCRWQREDIIGYPWRFYPTK